MMKRGGAASKAGGQDPRQMSRAERARLQRIQLGLMAAGLVAVAVFVVAMIAGSGKSLQDGSLVLDKSAKTGAPTDTKAVLEALTAKKTAAVAPPQPAPPKPAPVEQATSTAPTPAPAAAPQAPIAAAVKRPELLNPKSLAQELRAPSAAKSFEALKQATAAKPDQPEIWIDFGKSAHTVGRLADAMAAFAMAANTADKAKKPEIKFWSSMHFGDIEMAYGRLANARRSYDAAYSMAVPLTETGTEMGAWQRALALAAERLADVQHLSGILQTALAGYRTSETILDWQAQAEPQNAARQLELASLQSKIAAALRAQGQLPAALETLRQVLDIRKRLLLADPGDATQHKLLAETYIEIADVLRAQEDQQGALEFYRAARTISDRLIKLDPGNLVWQHHAAVAQIKLGDALNRSGDAVGAVERYQGAADILERLVADIDRAHALWQRDLAFANDGIGDVLMARRKPEAAEYYASALAIRQHFAQLLAKSEPEHLGWQRDLGISYAHLAELSLAQGDVGAAGERYKSAIAIAELLAAKDRSNAIWQADLARYQSGAARAQKK